MTADDRPAPTQTVLILEPEPVLLAAFSRWLAGRYAVLPVTTPAAARAVLAGRPRLHALLICDGADSAADAAFWDELADQRPELLRKAIRLRRAQADHTQCPSRFVLHKPVDATSLLRAIAGCAAPDLRKVEGHEPARPFRVVTPGPRR